MKNTGKFTSLAYAQRTCELFATVAAWACDVEIYASTPCLCDDGVTVFTNFGYEPNSDGVAAWFRPASDGLGYLYWCSEDPQFAGFFDGELQSSYFVPENAHYSKSLDALTRYIKYGVG